MDYAWLVSYGIPAGLTVGALVYGGYRKGREEMLRRWLGIEHVKEEAQQVAELKALPLPLGLPEGAVEVQQGPIKELEGLPISGTGSLVSVGTPALGRHHDYERNLERLGADQVVGSALKFESDTPTRLLFEKKQRPAFSDRTSFEYDPFNPHGYGNKLPEEVEKLVGQFGVSVEEAVKRLVARHDERNRTKDGEPIFFASLGGHAAVGLFVIQELRRRLPDAPILGVINLPRKHDQREVFLRLKKRFEEAGVTTWIISDQMEPDWINLDTVIGELLAGFAIASIFSDGRPRLNNLIRSMTGGKVGAVLRFEYQYSDVVAHPYQPDPSQPLQYYVYRNDVISELFRLINLIEEGHGKPSIRVPVERSHEHICDLALAAVRPGDMRDIRDFIERSRDAEDAQLVHLSRPHLHPQGDHETLFVPWSHPIKPDLPRARVGVIRVRAVRDPDGTLSELVKFPNDRRYPPTTKSPNGVHVTTTDDEWDTL